MLPSLEASKPRRLEVPRRESRSEINSSRSVGCWLPLSLLGMDAAAPVVCDKLAARPHLLQVVHDLHNRCCGVVAEEQDGNKQAAAVDARHTVDVSGLCRRHYILDGFCP